MQRKCICIFAFFLLITTLFLSLSIDTTRAEAFENIDEKDARVIYVMRDLEKSFTFRNEALDITYINISTDLNVGNVEAIVEALKSTSSMVSTPPEGRVYKNINIWVGDNKLQHRLVTADVGFRVDRRWLEDNDVSENSVKLSIYRSGSWYVLPTEKVDEDDDYIYYEAPTSGDLRHHFAIVEHIETEPVPLDFGEETVGESNLAPELTSEGSVLALEGDAGIAASEPTSIGSDIIIFFIIPALMLVIVLYTSYVGETKEHQDETIYSSQGSQDENHVPDCSISDSSPDTMNGQEIPSKSSEYVLSEKGR